MSQAIQAVSTQGAPGAIGPYSQAIIANGFVFCSGQIPLDPNTGLMVVGDIGAQTQRVMLNLSAVLAAAGTSLDHAVRATIFLCDLADFAAVNEVYAAFFGRVAPARATVQVSRLPRDARVEIDLIALVAGP